MAVLGRIVVADVPASLTAETTSAIDTDWLTVVAPVRTPLARLEAHQLEAATPFAAWTSRPGDPWQANEPADANGDVPETRFVAVYGPAGTVDADPANPQKAAAIGVLDAWGETVPVDAQTTTAAFGFNAPSARAPQAILIAVPPVETQQLTTQGLLDIVAEARDLTRVRAARPPDLDAFSGALPSAFLPASGETAVVLT